MKINEDVLKSKATEVCIEFIKSQCTTNSEIRDITIMSAAEYLTKELLDNIPFLS